MPYLFRCFFQILYCKYRHHESRPETMTAIHNATQEGQVIVCNSHPPEYLPAWLPPSFDAINRVWVAGSGPRLTCDSSYLTKMFLPVTLPSPAYLSTAFPVSAPFLASSGSTVRHAACCIQDAMKAEHPLSEVKSQISIIFLLSSFTPPPVLFPLSLTF